jgi:TRAP-type mannitol/chloroaromatic compound transport system permease small subunit
MARLSRGIDWLNERVGRAVAWFALAMVLVEFAFVLMSFVFGLGSLIMQESVVYLHGAMFMLGAGYTLLHDGHVRVDVFYRDASPSARAKVDLAGSLLFLVPVCVLIFIYAWPYVAQSWAVGEGSMEGSGIQGVYLLKTVVLLFCALLALQGLSQATKAWLTLKGKPPAPPETSETGV